MLHMNVKEENSDNVIYQDNGSNKLPSLIQNNYVVEKIEARLSIKMYKCVNDNDNRENEATSTTVKKNKYNDEKNYDKSAIAVSQRNYVMLKKMVAKTMKRK